MINSGLEVSSRTLGTKISIAVLSLNILQDQMSRQFCGLYDTISILQNGSLMSFHVNLDEGRALQS